MAVHRRAGFWWRRGLALVALAVFLTCGGDDGGSDEGTVISGTAYWSAPVRGATVVAFQLVDGQRTLEVGRTTTGDDGTFSLATGNTYEHVEIDVTGGAYSEPSGGDVVLDATTVLQGVALDLQIGEQRAGVTISPWTHLAVTLGRARLNAGKEGSYGLAVGEAIDRLRNHTGFDATKTTVAPVSAAASSPTESVKHGLSLAGLSKLAALAAVEQGATVQSINTVELTKVLARDARSNEALFDGNGAEMLFVGATCPPPPGCSIEGPGCYATCAVHVNTLRARLGSAVLAFLISPQNGTTLNRDDVGPWLETMRTNVDTELFGTEAIEPFDTIGPTITWQAPAADATVAGAIAVEVTAADPLGVMSLTVTAETPTPMPLIDTDPAPGRFAAQFSTSGLAEGPLVLTASATDTEDNTATAPRNIILNNVVGGTVSGVVYKGRVGAATVRVFRFDNAIKGVMMGQGTTQSDGSFTNVMIADGYTGPLLIEAGFGGTYPEEAASATVTLDVTDRLRTVIPSYADGNAVSNLAVTPLTSFATTYLEYLQSSSQGGTTVPARWTTARTAMEAHFGVANIYDLVPLAPAEMTTFAAAARYGMVLVGLSETARTASTLGGGDGGTFGSAMNGIRVVRVLDTDLADGCWDGRQGSTPLVYGGTQGVTIRSTRRDLANMIVSYLNDGARNQTPYAGAGDVLSQLDTLSNGGGNTSPGSCAATGKLNPDAGSQFDQTPPVVSFVGATPPAGFVRGTITVDAMATDDLDIRPTLRFTVPLSTADADGDMSDSDAHHTFDTTALADGPLVVTLEAVDDAGNPSLAAASTRTFTVDNTGPTINIGGITDGSWYSTGPVVTYSATEANLSSLTATLDGLPFSSGGQVSAIGMHTLVVTAQDQAGATAMRTVTFYVDPTAPTLTLGTVTPSGTVIRQTLSITVTADDNLKSLGSLGTDIAVTATGPSGAVTPTSVTPSTLGDMRRQVVATFNTALITDGTLTVRFNVSDRAANPATQLVVTRTMDNTPPTVNVGGVSDGMWYSSAPTLTFSQTDANPGTTTATLDGAAFSSGSMVTTEGQHTLVVSATDQAGNPASQTVNFFVDLSNPVLSLVSAAPPTWIRQTLDVTAAADDSLKSLGSLGSNIVVTATGPLGVVSLTPSYPPTGDMSRQARVMVDTTAIDDASGGGTLTLRFDVTDRSGRAATQLVLSRMMDNNPPDMTTINNVGLLPIPTYTNDTTPTITGTVETGGSPVTISLTIGAQAPVQVTPSGGTWSYTVPAALADGQYVINATATDDAGNSAMATSVTMNIDTAGPTVTFQTSNVLDERLRCNVNVNVNTSTGAINTPGTPVTYTCSGTATDLSPGGVTLNKYVARLVDTSTNPIAWSISTSDVGGAGVANASDTVRFQIYRTTSGASWVNATPVMLSGSTLTATANVLSGDWPELLTHTATFTVSIQAKDQLGNWGTPATRTWNHAPLADPVALVLRGNAPTNSADVLFPYSLHRHSLFPGAGQTGPASAMSNGLQANEPRALFTFDLVNPHPTPLNVGFFLPVIAGATYTTRVWDTDPWIAASSMTLPNNGTCAVNPWPNPSWSARINHSAPFNCNTGSCTCNGAGWTQPADSLPGSSTLALPDNTLVVRAVDLSALPAEQQLPLLGLTSTVGGRPFYEFQIPAAPSGTQGRLIRVLVGFSSLDFYAPYVSGLDGVQESDGLGSEQHKTTGGYIATMTATFYERWGACFASSGGNCTTARPRRHLRALVEARISVPLRAMMLNVRARAANSVTAAPEMPPHLGDGDMVRDNELPFLWETCEDPGYAPYIGQSCSPNLPTTANSSL